MSSLFALRQCMSIKHLFSLYNNVIVCIIESVDSVCRDSADMQYMIIQKVSPNLKNGKSFLAFITMDCSSSGVFMMNNMPSGAKKHHKSTEALQK